MALAVSLKTNKSFIYWNQITRKNVESRLIFQDNSPKLYIFCVLNPFCTRSSIGVIILILSICLSTVLLIIQTCLTRLSTVSSVHLQVCHSSRCTQRQTYKKLRCEKYLDCDITTHSRARCKACRWTACIKAG